ncbi:type IX secretion system membrane protein PorP/SprF [Fulvivirga sp. RKSG066]|uniref:PorP/SprF family type IX secretion system membrane protein n=1 Tax=Fulvivirga aurantia TaxID=2529383 RepID=UPI0012BC9805|nr:PorP/SprF family type IX secretion system membrane protein [Fulvivirga aurantia]MTI21973.1 type IX secretion system membrane protein PorP/SprF [Fulvivirga aurantia]
MDHFFCRLSIFLLTICALTGHAQEIPVYNHYYTNPYLFNPSEAGTDAFMSVSLNHRQQWRGIEGAPVVSTLSFQTPFDYKKWALGVNVRNFQRGLITTTDFMATYAYTVYLTKEATVHFGLSAGVTSNSLDLEDIEDLDDPVLSDFANNNMQPAANFGMKIKSPTGFNLGFALPRLFRPNFINAQDFESYDFSPLDEVVVMGYFKRKMDKKIVTRRRGGINRRVALEDAYAPLQIYGIYRYSALTGNQAEVLATLHIGESIWVGGAYRFNYGPSGLFGLNIGAMSFSYAYEPASNQVTGFEQGTHEVQLKIRIGEKKKLEKTKPILRTIVKKETHEARFSKDDVQTGGDQELEGGKMFYVVIKEYRDFNSADDLVRRLKDAEDLTTDIFYNKNSRRYYVYTYKTTSSKEANKEKKAVAELTKFKSVKIIIVDE